MIQRGDSWEDEGRSGHPPIHRGIASFSSLRPGRGRDGRPFQAEDRGISAEILGTGAIAPDLGALYCLDSIDLLEGLPADCLDLVITSPPFPLNLEKEYGNPTVDGYLDWFVPFAEQIKRALKPAGSFVLDLGGAWLKGAPVRSLYHYELAIRLAKEFHLAQEFYHYNPAHLPSPAEWVTIRRIRVKDAVNVVLWFGKTRSPKADNRKILRPYGDSMKAMLGRGYVVPPGGNRQRPSGHAISEGFGVDNGGSIPSNLLRLANTASNSRYLRACRARGIKPHPARYPEGLVQFFLDFLTDEGDLVYGPFAGSNVTGSVCEQSGRRWLASEQDAGYAEGSRLRFESTSSGSASDDLSDPNPRDHPLPTRSAQGAEE